MSAVYQPRVADRSSFVTVRGLRYHLRCWETPAGAGARADRPAPLLLCLHGWMDVSASYQFIVDALARRWRVVAPDWRGFGLSEALPCRETTDSYAFVDYLGDLDALIDALSPQAPVRLVGHSMGGNVATLYAGIRPERVAGLVNLEGFGLAATEPADAGARLRRWLDELRAPVAFRGYPTLEAVAERLCANNPRLPLPMARFLAAHWARPDGDGFVLRADPAHKRVNPVPYRVDEALACWRAVTAPVLWVASTERSPMLRFTLTDEYRQRLTAFRRLTEVTVADAAHMLHHDQPARIAGLIEEFFRDD
ncbi:MAG: alpha/beta fold hydrolase [Lautropia sp.]